MWVHKPLRPAAVQQQGWRRWLPESWRVASEQKQQPTGRWKGVFAPEFLNRIDQAVELQRLGD